MNKVNEMMALLSLAVFIALCAALTAVNYADTQAAEGKEFAVYTLGGYNVRAYVFEADKPVWDGHAWDQCDLINPTVVGERVYIPASKYDGEDNHFFYVDQVERFTGAVYKVNSGAISYIEDEHGLDVEKDETYQVKNDGYMIGPEINPNGMVRVYVSTFCDPDAPKVGKRFYYRHDLTLLQLGSDESAQ